MKLAGAGVQSAQEIDNGYDSATIGSRGREELIAGAQREVAEGLQLRSSKALQSYGSEPKDRSREIDLDTGERGSANVLQFRGGVAFPSSAEALDPSHRIAQPDRAAWNSPFSYSSPPESENSVQTRLVISRDGLSVQRRAA